MNINWTKFWTEQLPFCFRKERILALIAALCAIIARLWNDWTTWGERARQRAAYTWQVFWLERLVWLEMGVVIIIEPADGRPVDFVVNVSRISSPESYDENRLRALVDSFKLAGKTYRIVDSAISREVRFVNHLCQLAKRTFEVKFADYQCMTQLEIFQGKFINHVCSQPYQIEENNITVNGMYDGYENRYTYTFKARYSVASDLELRLLIVTAKGEATYIKQMSKGLMNCQLKVVNGSSDYRMSSVTPYSDSVYYYTC